MNKKEFDAIVADAVNDSELTISDIPAIDLYVDQIINLVAEKQKHGSERFCDKQLTKTMINNYSKDGVITPVKGKKYTREQILQILTVYSLKSTLSIGEIKRILAGAYAIEGFDGESLAEMYERYTRIKGENRIYTGKVIDGMIEANSLDVEKEEDYLALLGGIVSLSAYFKCVAEAMIDERFPKIDEEEEDKSAEKDAEKEKKKEEKKEKKKKEKEEKEKEKEKENKSV